MLISKLEHRAITLLIDVAEEIGLGQEVQDHLKAEVLQRSIIRHLKEANREGTVKMAKNNIKITVDKEYLVNMLLFLGEKVEDCYQVETDRVIDSLIQQIDAGVVVTEGLDRE